MTPLCVAVVGAGVAGITTAFLLQERHRVTLFDKNDYLGGHTNTVVIAEGPDAGTPVDTGFIVLNDRTYPLLHRLLRRLGVGVRWADMSFGFHCERSGLQYSGRNLDALFAQRRNLLRPAFYALLAEIHRFGRAASRDLREDRFGSRSLGEYLDSGGYGEYFRSNYLLPMGAAIWSTPAEDMLAFPAVSFARFFHNHGLLTLRDRPRWQTVLGGSHAYVQAFRKAFTGEIRAAEPVAAVRRAPEGAILRFSGGGERRFDRVVLAAHADESLRLLADPSPEERSLLGAWRYSKNRTVLHTDAAVLPPNPRAWASWNYCRELGANGDRLVLTYDMNNLQGLRARERYCVTLNRARPIPENRIIREFLYTHPMYTVDSLAAQATLPSLNGRRNSYFCGSYFGYGFHEDAVRSANEVAKCFGLSL